jgi:hypothetical protein
MRRREVIAGLAGVVIVRPLAAGAQQLGERRRRRIGVLTPAAAQFHSEPLGRALEQRGHKEGVNIVLAVTSADGQLERDAFFVVAGQSGVIAAPLVELALRHRLPTAVPLREHVRWGGLMSYGADEIDHWERVADQVDRLLRGASTAQIPVEQPTKFNQPMASRRDVRVGSGSTDVSVARLRCRGRGARGCWFRPNGTSPVRELL